MTVVLPPAKYTDDARPVSFHDQLKERVQALPGVNGVGTVDNLPLQGGNTTRFSVEGDPIPLPGEAIEANFRVVSESYFQTLGVPLIAGRMFDERDKADATGVVIIGKSLADKVFAGRDPVGRRLASTSGQTPPVQVVGVVGDVKIGGLDEEIRPVIYYAYRQDPALGTNLVVRTDGDPTALAAAIRNEARTLEPDVAIFNVRAMEELISSSPAAFMRRFPALLISIFAGVALLLASIGIYGVVSYSVSQQTHYIGVRMALGAKTSDIMKMVLKQGLILTLLGVGIGVVAALGLMRLVPTNSTIWYPSTSSLLSAARVIASAGPAAGKEWMRDR